jgi:hypothetical protein
LYLPPLFAGDTGNCKLQQKTNAPSMNPSQREKEKEVKDGSNRISSIQSSNEQEMTTTEATTAPPPEEE